MTTDSIDWLQSPAALCKVDRYTPSDAEERTWKTDSAKLFQQTASNPLKVLSWLQKDLEKCAVGIQNVLNASNNTGAAGTKDSTASVRQAMSQRNMHFPGGYSVCDEEINVNVSSNRGSPDFHLSVTSTYQKESKDEESNSCTSPNVNPDPDEISYYCSRLSHHAIAMARKELNEHTDGTTHAPKTAFTAAGDHSQRSVGAGAEEKHKPSKMGECRFEESPTTKHRTIHYKEENTEIPNKSEPCREGTKSGHHRKRFGNDEYTNTLSKGILVYANNVVSDMMVSIMKTMKVKVNDSNIVCAVLKKVLLKHSMEVVSDLIDSCMKNLHDVTGTLMTDSDFVSAVKRSLFTQGSQKVSEIVQAMLNRLHNALIVQKQAGDKPRSQSMAFASVKTGGGADGKTQNMRFSAAKTEMHKEKEMTCAETVGNHILKEGLTKWQKRNDPGGSHPQSAKASGGATWSPDNQDLATDSWARDLIVTALLLIQYHLVQQENAMKEGEGGRSSKATGTFGFLSHDKGGCGSPPLSARLCDPIKQSDDEQSEANPENDMSGVIVTLIQKLINETVGKLGGSTGTVMADETSRSIQKYLEGPGPSGLSETDHSYEEAISGLTKMILDQCDVDRKEGGSGPFIDHLVDTVTKLCLMIAKYSNPEAGLEDEGAGEDAGGMMYSKDSDTGESRVGSGEDTTGGRKVVVTNQNAPENIHHKQLQAILQWVAASQLNVPVLYFMDDDEETLNKLQQLSSMAVERGYSVGEVMQAVLKYEKERQLGEALGNLVRLPVLDWLLQHLREGPFTVREQVEGASWNFESQRSRSTKEKTQSRPVMETVKNILGVAQAIYAQYERVKCCKCQSRRLVDRIQILMRPIKTLQAQSTRTASPQLEEVLQKLLRSLEKAKRLLEKYSHQNWMQKFLKASQALEEFSSVNDELSDAAEGLSLLLQVEQTFKESFRRDVLHQENNKDFEDDRMLLEEMLKNSKETRDGVENIQSEVKQIQGKLDEILQKLDSRPRTSTADVETIEIEKSLLSKWTFLKEFESHVLYKGEYHKFPVAIKVFKNPAITSSQKVRDLFRKEIKAMKRFESPHILRMYGICIDESSSSPEFSIVTEYCEKGTLRDVLRKEPDLSWKIRIQMALHAAIGLYRLHQTGDKSQLHGCINSNKFLVAEGYNVKLSGFELSQTESSLRRKHKEKKQKEISPSAYVSPQGLTSVNHIYDLPSEIYSFGIVLWEVATGKTPFKGCTSQEIYQKVCKEGYQEPLGEDCPAVLREVIHRCRNYQPSKRPSAEAIVDSLLSISSVTTVTS